MNEQVGSLSNVERFVVAGIGGLAPVLLNLFVIDLDTLLLGVTPLAVVSAAIRSLALFGVGGFVGWLHKKETDRVKLFQFGIAAPALIIAFMNGNQIAVPRVGTSAPSKVAATFLLDVVASANAQSASLGVQNAGIKQFSYPKESPTQQVLRGAFGVISKRLWFVICGSYPDAAQAQQSAQTVRARGFNADVYAPYGDTKYYAVVIGANLSFEDAQELKTKAIKSGLSTDTYLWTFPDQK
jgi:hypothetical protein